MGISYISTTIHWKWVYLYLHYYSLICSTHIYCMLTLCLAFAQLLSRVRFFAIPLDCSPPGSSVHGDSPGKHTGVACHALLQGIFPTQGSNPGLPHCRQILYHLSHQGSPRKLEWVAYPFSRGSFQARNWTVVSCMRCLTRIKLNNIAKIFTTYKKTF